MAKRFTPQEQLVLAACQQVSCAETLFFSVSRIELVSEERSPLAYARRTRAGIAWIGRRERMYAVRFARQALFQVLLRGCAMEWESGHRRSWWRVSQVLVHSFGAGNIKEYRYHYAAARPMEDMRRSMAPSFSDLFRKEGEDIVFVARKEAPS